MLVCPNCKRGAENVRPGTVLNAGSTISRLADLPEAQRVDSPRAAIERIQTDLRNFRDKQKLDQVVVVNVASTEPPFELGEAHQSLDRLAARTGTSPADAPAGQFALRLGGDRPGFAVHQFHAVARRVGPGAAGTGAAAESRHRRQGRQDRRDAPEDPCSRRCSPRATGSILSWVGHNIFGNRDGVVLERSRKTRRPRSRPRTSWSQQIVGYKPQTHVSIEYIESLDDWKTAWDHIHFRGFLGTKMIMQFTWQGCDSILAGPLVIDLARLALFAQRRGEVGVLEAPGLFLQEPDGRRRSTTSSSSLRCWRSMWAGKVQLSRDAESSERSAGATDHRGPRLRSEDSASRLTRCGCERPHETRLQHQRLSEILLRRGRAPPRRRSAIAGVEIMADVPHAWPAFLLDEQKQAIRDALAKNKLAISNINAFMMHAINDPRQTLLASVVDRAGRALSPDPHRPHDAGADAGHGTRRAVHHHGAGRAGRAGRNRGRRR